MLAACAAVLCACSSLSGQVRPTSAVATDFAATVYVVRRGWHTDIGFTAGDLHSPLAQVRSVFPGARFVLFGFGDRHYLTHSGPRSIVGALWPGPGLVLATGLRASPAEAFGQDEVLTLAVSRAQLQALQRFVWRTLAIRHGAVTPLQAGPYAGSVYYGSVLRYSALYTCNTWSADALKSAGLPVRSFGVEFAGELWRQVRRIHAGQQRAASTANGHAAG